jgi:hypothetical protein
VMHKACSVAVCGDVAQRESTAFATPFRLFNNNNLRLTSNHFKPVRFLLTSLDDASFRILLAVLAGILMHCAVNKYRLASQIPSLHLHRVRCLAGSRANERSISFRQDESETKARTVLELRWKT